jgi:hypothetical protein
MAPERRKKRKARTERVAKDIMKFAIGLPKV